MEYDHQRLIRKFGLKADDFGIHLTYLNVPCRISRESGGIKELADDG